MILTVSEKLDTKNNTKRLKEITINQAQWLTLFPVT
jgi:hypothetical protein